MQEAADGDFTKGLQLICAGVRNRSARTDHKPTREKLERLAGHYSNLGTALMIDGAAHDLDPQMGRARR